MFFSFSIYLFPGTLRSRDMSRKRHRLVPETLGLKRPRERRDVEADPLRGESGNHGNPRARLGTSAGSGLASGNPVWWDPAYIRSPAPVPVNVSVTRSFRPGSARAAVAELVQLFPRVLFEDALPPIVLRNQVYSLVPDRTVADRQLVRGVRATDGGRFPASRALPRFPIIRFAHHLFCLSASIGSFWAKHCASQGGGYRASGNREHAKS